MQIPQLRTTLNIGILAHVDAGKTSLTERLLFDTGAIDRLGSVDAGDTRTDTGAIERQRGITIRSAVAAFTVGDTQVNLIDTPGHSDFIAEVERALDVLDGAVLLVSAVEGVQAQTRVLLRTLRRLGLPTLVFVNKVDRAGARTGPLLDDIRRRLTPSVVPLADVRDAGTPRATVAARALDDAAAQTLSEVDDTVLAALVDGPPPGPAALRRALVARTGEGLVHPVLFGSALGGQGVPQLLDAVREFLPAAGKGDRTAPPSGTVFAVRRGTAGERIGYLRLYDGEVRARQKVTFLREDVEGGAQELTARITGLRVVGCAGDVAGPGQIAEVRGVAGVRVGDRLGPPRAGRAGFAPPTLETVARAVHPGRGAGLRAALLDLADQDPLIHARPAPAGATALLLYGEVQKEVLGATLAQEFDIEATFEPSRIRCVERPVATGEDVEEMGGHSTTGLPATVGLRIAPGPHGSGRVFTYETELGALPRAFHQAVEDTVHATLAAGGPHGWPVTDCRVTLIRSGFDSPVSVAGDFRTVTALVVRRALERCGTRVFEPVHTFEVEIPLDALAPVTARLAAHGAEFGETTGGRTSWLITGELTARRVRDMELALPGLTHGEGVWWSRVAGDRPVRE
ncbi:tetracycline resistance ribosomal protection protein Otr(A) [Streptomyces sp. VRA16 Mangrove soil]|uniref:tetracycline resistance ribosomal protection protein Otr(A) n=1 Tax=Streptomyces sp. VRA16 Mangrove soil TaxID=2817434 RepID=UPI001A9E05BE|nr:tetracycline resistance ribosomal protection protein Otr(A) [Streptomyces sp. VRA16 Mangrove soil]MBO1330580.1 tetracycline resistance ribosomal protection protein Otr(A) [Streptomyces sp. VRA16 Mangrove soil]